MSNLIYPLLLLRLRLKYNTYYTFYMIKHHNFKIEKIKENDER